MTKPCCKIYAPVGAVVHNSYWNEDYTVIAHVDRPVWGHSVTVKWHGRDGLPGRIGEHSTALDPRDVILSQPAS